MRSRRGDGVEHSVPRDPKRLLGVSCRLVVVEHEDGETLTQFASDMTLIERRGAGISDYATVARDIAAIGMPTGAAYRPD